MCAFVRSGHDDAKNSTSMLVTFVVQRLFGALSRALHYCRRRHPMKSGLIPTVAKTATVRMRGILTTLPILFLVAVPANAATYYVSQSGNDANSCATAQSTSATNQKASIAAGVACARAGDTVLIHGGTYTGSDATIDSQSHTVNSGTSFANAITISGYPGEAVVIQ